MLKKSVLVVVLLGLVCCEEQQHFQHHALVSVDCSIEHIQRGIGLDCDQAEPEELPKYLNEKFITELKIRHKNITNLGPKIFESWTNLMILEITGCGVKSISADAFSTLAKLENLNLEGVKYYDIELDIEHGQLNMTDVDVIYDNDITVLPASIFKHNVNLITLILRKNQIEEILDGTFVYLENLENLYISRNKLREVKRSTLTGLKNLKDLDLSFNLIEHIASDTFYELTSLERLRLEGNPLKEITKDHLLPLSNLKTLDLFRTNLSVLPNYFPETLEVIDIGNTGVTTLPNAILDLPNLKHLGMRDNPWVCTAEMMKVASRLWNEPGLVSEHDKESSMCKYPPELVDKKIEDLAPVDFPHEVIPTVKIRPSTKATLTEPKETLPVEVKGSTKKEPKESTKAQEATVPYEFISPEPTDEPENAQLASAGPSGTMEALIVVGAICSVVILVLVISLLIYFYRRNSLLKFDMPQIFMKNEPINTYKTMNQTPNDFTVEPYHDQPGNELDLTERKE
ncbi:unnamed protein product [Owenia fusiformis]|uniref:Uncharacterized protein n=1 Tax=Owenia fusiformis TaxID=6347 RepID=A0A8J1TYZ2_OWEFU|nr:unnamed protein product [Owenia fusiformis]